MKNNSIILYERKNNYYAEIDGITHSLNANSLKEIKKLMTLPFKIEFISMNLEEVRRVILNIYQMGMEVTISEVTSYVYEVEFKERKNIIGAYRIIDVESLYNTDKNADPYTLAFLGGGKTALLGVTKDYAKQNEGNYYFLDRDLSTEDKKRLQSFYTEVEYDYLYNYEYDLGRISLKKQNLSL